MTEVSSVYQTALNLERIDTHAHLVDAYMSLEEAAEGFRNFSTTQQLIDARVYAEGCRRLYVLDPGAFLRPDSDPEIFRQARDLRAKGSWEAISHALRQARILTQLAFCEWNGQCRPFLESAGRPKLAYLAFIDTALSGEGQYPCPDFVRDNPDFRFYAKLCQQLGPLNTLTDYLEVLDETIDSWRAKGIVGLKAAVAYTTGLATSDPTRAEAQSVFARKNDMTEQDFRIVHDFAFRHALEACRRNSLPVVIHTGFQIWGHANLTQSNPMLLHNLLIDPRYRGINFVLLHGGNPYIGETTYLAGMFPNVFLDFTWIGWMAPTRFRMALAEWLAMVPHDRMCWGSDASTPESIAGADGIMRRLIAEVLETSISQGIIDEKYALEFLTNTYQETPKRLFSL